MGVDLLQNSAADGPRDAPGDVKKLDDEEDDEDRAGAGATEEGFLNGPCEPAPSSPLPLLPTALATFSLFTITA